MNHGNNNMRDDADLINMQECSPGTIGISVIGRKFGRDRHTHTRIRALTLHICMCVCVCFHYTYMYTYICFHIYMCVCTTMCVTSPHARASTSHSCAIPYVTIVPFANMHIYGMLLIIR